MRTAPDVSIFPPALCAACRQKPWTKWCRGCNVVYCDDHAERANHACKPDEVRVYPAPEPEGPQAAAHEPGRNGSAVAVQMPVQFELFTTPPPPAAQGGSPSVPPAPDSKGLPSA